MSEHDHTCTLCDARAAFVSTLTGNKLCRAHYDAPGAIRIGWDELPLVHEEQEEGRLKWVEHLRSQLE